MENLDGSYRCVCPEEGQEYVDNNVCLKKLSIDPSNSKENGITTFTLPENPQVLAVVFVLSSYTIAYLTYISILNCYLVVRVGVRFVLTEPVSSDEEPEELDHGTKPPDNTRLDEICVLQPCDSEDSVCPINIIESESSVRSISADLTGLNRDSLKAVVAEMFRSTKRAIDYLAEEIDDTYW